jgi:probable HAF family extracellular repeat protein
VTVLGKQPLRTLACDVKRGTLSVLPPLGGLDAPIVYDINKRGQIAGVSSNAGGENHAVIWEPARRR